MKKQLTIIIPLDSYLKILFKGQGIKKRPFLLSVDENLVG